MSIPYWLLRLLLMWEYICPRCRKGVKQSTHQCPHCGERFPLALKIPPTFLKDPKKLEAYVHKHIFPRVSEFERNYLTKYFTVIFSDGFESGDFSAWTETGGTPTIVTSPVHHGTYATSFDAGDLVGRWASGTPTTVFIRFYARWSTNPTAGKLIEFIHVWDAGWSDYFQLSIYNDSGTMQLFLNDVKTSTGTRVNYAFAVDTWYCFEVKVVTSATVGEYRVYLNGAEVITRTGLNTGTSVPDNLSVGNQYGDAGFSVILDCVVVADAYIGPEAAAGQQLFTLINEEGY